MSEAVTTETRERLNEAFGRIASPEVLRGEGLGNEIAFYIVEYAPADELYVSDRLSSFVSKHDTPGQSPHVGHINLFELIVGYLKKRKFWDKALQIQAESGDEALARKLSAPLDPSRLSQEIISQVPPTSIDILLMSGIGSAWPLVRAHALLNNLHALMGATPLVLFYPGHYDGQSLSLFGKVTADNYYRAFKL